MNKVELRPLAITDLALSYARKLDDKNIRHYRVSAIDYLVPGMGNDPVQLIKEYIEREEGPADIVLLDSIVPQGPSHQVEFVTDKVLSSANGTKKALLKHTSKGLLYEYMQVPDFTTAKKYGLETSFGHYLASFACKIGLTRFVPSKYFLRHITHCRYLSYVYEEKDEAHAFAALRSDLVKLYNRDLIIGNLTMPAVLTFADMVGSGNVSKAVFCFLFVDHYKLAEQLNTDFLNLPTLSLHSIGIMSETFEGGLGPRIGSSTEYKIETVDVSPTYEANNKVVLQAYEDSKEWVNEIAKSQNEALQKYDIKTESSNLTQKDERGRVISTQVNVDINIKKKE